jgi:hypothetical protein
LAPTGNQKHGSRHSHQYRATPPGTPRDRSKRPRPVVGRAKPPNPQSSEDDRATRVGRLQSLSSSARRLENERKPPHSDFARSLARTVAHDLFDSRVTAAAIGSRTGTFPDGIERAGSFERASANGSVGHGVAVANDHG